MLIKTCTYVCWWAISFGDEREYKKRVNNKTKSFLLRVHKKQRVEIDRPASSGDQAKDIYVSCPWPPLEATLPILNSN